MAQTSVSMERAQSWLDALACPQCRTALRHRADQLFCESCRSAWPISEGIPHFVEEFPYWGEIGREKMREVNRKAARGSWKAALLDSGDPEVLRASEMILNVDRANWQWLID